MNYYKLLLVIINSQKSRPNCQYLITIPCVTKNTFLAYNHMIKNSLIYQNYW